MKSFSTSVILVGICFVLVLSTASASPASNPTRQKRNVFQQFLINQIVNVLPVNVREKINDAAETFGLTRNQFLLRCLKELQAFQNYSKIDFITAIQKTTKFIDEKLSDEQKETVDTLAPQGIQLAHLLFDNALLPGDLDKLYDLEVKIVRQQIDAQSFVDQLPILVEEILNRHA